jgi:hypothetical protein
MSHTLATVRRDGRRPSASAYGNEGGCSREAPSEQGSADTVH